MSFLKQLFTWWNGQTLNTRFYTWRKGEYVGSDEFGNKYYRAKSALPQSISERRWVIYNGANDASRVPAEWHGWLHGSFDGVPESNLPPPRIWETEYSPNATGTTKAHRPHRDLQDTAYEAWSPDA